MTREELNLQPVSMFGFDNNLTVKPISLKELEQSIRVEGKGGRILQTRPVQSWNVINYIIGLLVQANVNYSLESVFVQKRNSFPMLSDDEKNLGYNRENCPINRWMFDKLVACIQIPNIGNDLTSARLGFGFNDDGIQVAFGMNVHVCSNFAIMGGQLMNTYKSLGKEPTSWEAMEYKLRDWVTNLEQMFAVETNLMERMQNKAISDNVVIERVIGGLYHRAIDQAYGSKRPAPFDTAGMSNLVQNIIKDGYDPTNAHQFDAHVISNVWDLYNYGTRILKPGIVDIQEIQQSSSMFADYLFDEFEILKN